MLFFSSRLYFGCHTAVATARPLSSLSNPCLAHHYQCIFRIASSSYHTNVLPVRQMCFINKCSNSINLAPLIIFPFTVAAASRQTIYLSPYFLRRHQFYFSVSSVPLIQSLNTKLIKMAWNIETIPLKLRSPVPS